MAEVEENNMDVISKLRAEMEEWKTKAEHNEQKFLTVLRDYNSLKSSHESLSVVVSDNKIRMNVLQDIIKMLGGKPDGT